MSNETRLTIIGRLTGAPELRFTPSGAAVANFTIASNARKFDRQTNEWKDEPPLFLRCSVWREQAENIAESLDKGTAVIAVGNLTQREYETREGEKRTVMELQVDEIGPSLRWGPAKVTRTQRGNGGSSGRVPTGRQQGGASTTDDPWATPTGDEPPF